MLARVAHNLGRRVKTHGLGIEQGGGEGGGMEFLDPRRNIDQQRKTGGMAFGETVRAETLDLLETVFREFWKITAASHAFYKSRTIIFDGADMAEGRHGAAQTIHLSGGEFGRDGGDFHRLLLK